MCGVAAILAPLPVDQRSALVDGMCGLLAHRGPDGQGLWSASSSFGPLGLTLGHRRLAIVDLSSTGAQPMTRGALTVSYNGELYNFVEERTRLAALGHTFVGSSDTEVLLALCQQHGVLSALGRTNGMFAFALADPQTSTLWLARDRFGEKPLYYLQTADTLVVASEPKAILLAARRLRIPIAVQRDVLSCYLADAEYEVGDATFFAPIRRVQPGQAIAFTVRADGGISRLEHRYYTLSLDGCPPQQGPRADRVFAELLTQSLHMRLRSDVPVAACLSGGLDSSSLVCLAARDGISLRTFSAVHAPGEPWDERPHIDAVVAHTGVENRQVDPASLLTPAAFSRFLEQHDEPVGGPSVWAQHAVYRWIAAHGLRVALSGQGADECLTGYGGALPAVRAELARTAQWPELVRELSAVPRPVARAVALAQALQSGVRSLVAQCLPTGYGAWLAHHWAATFARSRYFHAAALRRDLPPLPPDPPEAAAFDRRSLLHGYLYRLLSGPSLATILRYEDRNSMAASVEARAPFLDPRIIAHCLGRPPRDLAADGFTKLILRRAVGPVLPAATRERRDKVGFGAPPWRWLTGPLRSLVEDTLDSAHLAQLGFLRPTQLRYDFDLACRGIAPASWADGFWRALNVALWLRQQSLSV